MTRYDIAINRPLIDSLLNKDVEVLRKTIILGKWWPVTLERSPCSAICSSCKKDIPAKTSRYKVMFTPNPWKRNILYSRLYHAVCLPNEMMKIIIKKEKKSNVSL